MVLDTIVSGSRQRLGQGKPVPNWRKLVEPIQNHHFLWYTVAIKNLKRLSGRKSSKDLLKQGGPSRDEDG